MNVQSNSYTVIYATIMVILVAVGLSVTSISLKHKQELNVEKEKKQMILATIGVECTRDEAVDLYPKYIKQTLVINQKGEIVEGEDAFKIEIEKENLKPAEQRHYAIYETETDGKMIYILPVRGKGLWSSIWGYVALEEDLNTIVGVVFDHKSETPGLGAEIRTSEFQVRFKGKKLFDENKKFVSIAILKPGKSEPNNPHQIDGLSGATLTCDGVQAMLYNSLIVYENFIKNHTNN